MSWCRPEINLHMVTEYLVVVYYSRTVVAWELTANTGTW